jgi:hypothetical protein
MERTMLNEIVRRTGVRVAAIVLSSMALAVAASSCKSSGTKPAATPASAAAAKEQPKEVAPEPKPAAPATTAAPTPAATPAPAAANAPGGRAAGTGRAAAPPPPAPPAVMPAAPAPIVSGTKPMPDPRVGLKAGYWDAGEALWNMKRLSTTAPIEQNLTTTHSDLAFTGKYVIQGNYNGFEIFDISNPVKPQLVQTYFCPASQNDVSVYKNLVFMSSEATNSRMDCSFGNIPEPISKERFRGIRVFDIADVRKPKLVASVQTCRGSHTHTVVTQPGDNDNIYIYVSGTAGVRSAEEVPGCADGGADDPNTARFRLEVIKVPLKAPQTAAIVSSPRIFTALPPAPRNEERAALDAAGRRGGGAGGGGGAAAGAAGAAGGGAAGGAAAGGATTGAGAGAAGATGAGATAAAGGANAGRGGGRAAGPPTGPNQCHDITVYPDVGLAGGACAGLGLLLDIREAAHPIRIDFAADPNMSFWHSATFSNDGTRVMFSDEWGGGGGPKCRATDKPEWGANAIFAIERNKLVFKSYYKMPAAQTDFENCVAHNGSPIPIPGREVMIQAWYQGGVSAFDWTDPAHPFEVAYHDRGPLNGTRLDSAGSWSVYWYNGLIVSSEIKRGLDVFELVASPLISQNEIDAAKTVTMDYWNTQQQRRFVWPPSFAMARAFVDQLERSKGLSAARITAVRDALANAEKASGGARRTALTTLATSLNADAASSTDAAKVKMLATAVTDLAK